MKRYIWLIVALVLVIAAAAAIIGQPYLLVKSLEKYEELPERRAERAELDMTVLSSLSPGDTMTLSDGAVVIPVSLESAISYRAEVDEGFRGKFGTDAAYWSSDEYWDETLYSYYLYQKDCTLDGQENCPFKIKTRALFFVAKDAKDKIAETLPMKSEGLSGKGSWQWLHMGAGRSSADDSFPTGELMMFTTGYFDVNISSSTMIKHVIKLPFLKITLPDTRWASDTLFISCRYICVSGGEVTP